MNIGPVNTNLLRSSPCLNITLKHEFQTLSMINDTALNVCKQEVVIPLHMFVTFQQQWIILLLLCQTLQKITFIYKVLKCDIMHMETIENMI